MTVVILSERLGPVTQEERRLESLGAEVRGAPLWTLDEIRTNAADADVLILGAVEPFDAAAIEALPKLGAIVRRGVGTDNVDVEAATRHGILVANVPDASVEEVSDHALSLLLAIERRVHLLDAAVRAGTWHRDPSAIQPLRAPIRRMSDLTLGIVGFGRIGQALARKARPIYGSIRATDPYIDADVARDLGVDVVELDELLRTSNHISLHAPGGAGNRHLVDAEAMARMLPGTVLVNTARGGLVDESALASALAEGRLAGAGLDVTEREPVTPDDPVLSAQRTLFTAHSALTSTRTNVELTGRSVDAAAAIIQGRRPQSVVNREVLGMPHRRLQLAGDDA